MKKLLALALVAAATVTLAACESTGGSYVDSQGPYGDERTVGNDVRSAEPVFERRVTK